MGETLVECQNKSKLIITFIISSINTSCNTTSLQKKNNKTANSKERTDFHPTKRRSRGINTIQVVHGVILLNYDCHYIYNKDA